MAEIDPASDERPKVDWCDIVIFLEIVVIIGMVWCISYIIRQGGA